MATAGMETRAAAASPAVVAIAGWLLPGAGYWLIGQRARGTTIGVAVVLLFTLGLLIGGVRVIEVPTYNRLGRSVAPGEATALGYVYREIQAKPWSVAQVMTGPVAIAGGAASVYAASEAQGMPWGESHARVNEIAVLYTAVAGMLNLLALIDAAHRAGKLQEGR